MRVQTFTSDAIGHPLAVHQGGRARGQQNDVLHVSPCEIRAVTQKGSVKTKWGNNVKTAGKRGYPA